MKTSKREKLMKQIAAAALMLGIFSPLAEASISEKDGLSMADLTKVVRDMEVQRKGNSILVAGIMPKGCAEGATTSYDFRDGKHLVTFRMPSYPKCKEDYEALPDSEKRAARIDAADVFNEIRLKDLSGKLVLRHYKEGSRRATDRIQDEDLLDYEGKVIEVVGADAREKAEQERLAKEAQEARDRQLSDLETRLMKYCQDGDYIGLGQEIVAASHLLGDVSALLESISAGQKDALKKELSKASTAEEAKAAYDAYIEAAALNGWDEEELKEAYIEKRFEILDTMAEDAKSGDSKLSAVAKAIREWMTDLRAIDSRTYRKKKDKFAELYAELGTHAANNKNLAEAERYYDKAKSLTDTDGKIKIDSAMSKLYAEQFKACVKKNPAKMEACEKKYLSKAKDRANAIKEAMANRSGDDAAEDLAAFNAEYIQTFGAGMQFNWSGYGSMSQLPGAVDRFKMQTYREYQMQQQQMWLQRMYGIGPAPASTPTSGILGF